MVLVVYYFYIWLVAWIIFPVEPYMWLIRQKDHLFESFIFWRKFEIKELDKSQHNSSMHDY